MFGGNVGNRVLSLIRTLEMFFSVHLTWTTKLDRFEGLEDVHDDWNLVRSRTDIGMDFHGIHALVQINGPVPDIGIEGNQSHILKHLIDNHTSYATW